MYAGGDDFYGRISMTEPSSTKASESQTHWGQQETREFIAIRADLEKDFTVAKRNKTLWEAVSASMKERGYMRSPDQCKCKWKNLVNRYKGKETSDPDNGRQCPFFEEMHTVFTERANDMQRRLLLESEAGYAQTKKIVKKMRGERSVNFSEDEDNSEEKPARSKSRKGKIERIALDKPPRATSSTSSSSSSSGVEEMLKEFLHQQQRMEMQWAEMMERRAQERRMFEHEWQQKMENIERERMKVEHSWREREEQRRMKDEIRAERRDALLSTLLNKLIQDNNL